MTATPSPGAGGPPSSVRRLFLQAPVTWTLVVLCVATWLAEVLVPGLVDVLALAPVVGAREPWRFVTASFAHALEPWHVGFNMLALWMLGRGLENFLGRWRYLAVYLLAGLGGGALFVLSALPPSNRFPAGVEWYTGLVGASGSVFGLFGALLVAQRRFGQDTRRLWWLLALNAALPFLVPGIAWQAHVGGFVVGIAAMAALMPRPRPGGPVLTPRPWPRLVLLGLLLVAAVAVKYALVG